MGRGRRYEQGLFKPVTVTNRDVNLKKGTINKKRVKRKAKKDCGDKVNSERGCKVIHRGKKHYGPLQAAKHSTYTGPKGGIYYVNNNGKKVYPKASRMYTAKIN